MTAWWEENAKEKQDKLQDRILSWNNSVMDFEEGRISARGSSAFLLFALGFPLEDLGLGLTWALGPLGLGPTWALGLGQLGRLGPWAHFGPGQLGPWPIWALENLGPGPFGPQPIWALAH